MMKQVNREEYKKMKDVDKIELSREQYLDMAKILLDCNGIEYLTSYITLIVLINNGLIIFKEIELNEITGRVDKYSYLESDVKIGRLKPKDILYRFITHAYDEHNCKNYVFISLKSPKVYIFTLTELGKKILKEECSPAYYTGCFDRKIKSDFRDEINKIITGISTYKPYIISSIHDLREKMNKLI